MRSRTREKVEKMEAQRDLITHESRSGEAPLIAATAATKLQRTRTAPQLRHLQNFRVARKLGHDCLVTPGTRRVLQSSLLRWQPSASARTRSRDEPSTTTETDLSHIICWY